MIVVMLLPRTTCTFLVNGYNKEGDLFELGTSFSGGDIEYVELVFEGAIVVLNHLT